MVIHFYTVALYWCLLLLYTVYLVFLVLAEAAPSPFLRISQHKFSHLFAFQLSSRINLSYMRPRHSSNATLASFPTARGNNLPTRTA